MLETSAPWIVLKFGGTSVDTADAWQHIRKIVSGHLQAGHRPLLVCSALAGISDILAQAYRLAVAGEEYLHLYRRIVQRHRSLCEALRLPLPVETESLIWQLRRQLVSCAHERRINPACEAKVMALGELLACSIGAAWLQTQGLHLPTSDARELLVSESHSQPGQHYLSAECAPRPNPGLARRLAQQSPQGRITQGFIARDSQGGTVLLGRGGSDTSAACLAALLQAVGLEIWTDVPGLFSAPPELVPQARLLTRLDRQQARQLALRGAKVLHPRCLKPLEAGNIPLTVRDLTLPECAGTQIGSLAGPCRALLLAEGLLHFRIAADEAAVRQAFADEGLAITSLASGPSGVSLLIDPRLHVPEPGSIPSLRKRLAGLGKTEFAGAVTTVSLIGLADVPAQWRQELPAEARLHLQNQSEEIWILPAVPAPEWLRGLHRRLIEPRLASASRSELRPAEVLAS